jgi:hypothetical protein
MIRQEPNLRRDSLAYLTGAGSDCDRPLAVGRKFDAAGGILPYAGNTFICHVSQKSPAHAALLLSFVNALSYRSRQHEARLIALARARGVDGVICGHFHIAGLHHDHGLIYANCGDWLDSMTALAEAHDGALHLLHARASTAAMAQNAPSFNLESV